LKLQSSVNLNPTSARHLLVKFTTSSRRQLLQAANPAKLARDFPRMPINRLTTFAVLAAALFVIAPVQATTSKTHGKAVPAKQAQQTKHTHGKLLHHKQTQTRHTAATHKSTSSKLTTSVASIADTTSSATTNAVATLAIKPALPVFTSLQAGPFALSGPQAAAKLTPPWLSQAPSFNPAPMMLSQSIVPATTQTLPRGEVAANSDTEVDDTVAATRAEGDELATALDGTESATDLRKSLIAMAMKLRDIRYVRGGHDPSTGFDCSGFVRYVFAHAIGMQLPNNSASQFLAGLKVKRADMKPGDLVFFRTHGRRNISHVGIYISNGRFIHSPNTGKSVEISSLDEGYWAKRFAGAKRPEAIAMVANKG
jgi:cell wall-associated NlpC family hydrolase